MSTNPRRSPSGEHTPVDAEGHREPSGAGSPGVGQRPAGPVPAERQRSATTFAVLWFLLPLATLIGLAFLSAP